MKRIKVFGGWTFNEAGEKVRTIVATTSQQRVADLTGITLVMVKSHWRKTPVAEEEALGRSQPETVFKASSLFQRDFKPQESV